jgi:hypothetical protein
MQHHNLKNLKSFAVWTLVTGLAMITNAGNAAAQFRPGSTLADAVRSRHGHHASPQQVPPFASTPTWSPVFPSWTTLDTAPARGGQTAVYDSNTNNMIVYGGVDGEFNLPFNPYLQSNANNSGGAFAGAWSELYPNSNWYPPPRYWHSAVYDKTNNRMIIFGGCGDAECLINLNDTWVLSNANGTGGAPSWTQLAPTGNPPSPRTLHNAVYDSANNRMIVYSGESNNGNTVYSDVWVLTNANGLGGTPAWTQLTPTTTPDAVDGCTAVYDSATNKMIVFSGGDFLNSVWTLSNANGLGGSPVWTNLIANGTAGSPAGRWAGQAIYDSTNNRMTIYGGNIDAGITSPSDYDYVATGDVWVLTNANGSGGTPVWTQLHPKVAGDKNIPPAPRMFFSGVYDSTTNSMIVFGGETIEGIYQSTWVLSHANGL